MPPGILVTATSRNHFQQLHGLIRSAQLHLPIAWRFVVYDLLGDLAPHELLKVNSWCGVEYRKFDFTGQHDVGAVFTALHEGLNSDLCLGVKGKACIHDGVGNGVAQLVRMACSHRFRRKQPCLCHGPPSSLVYIKSCCGRETVRSRRDHLPEK